MLRPRKAPKGMKKRIKKLKREVLNEMTNYRFNHHCTSDNCTTTSSNKEDQLCQQFVDQPSISEIVSDPVEKTNENVAAWLMGAKGYMTIGQVKSAFTGATYNNIDYLIRESIIKRINKLTSADLLPCCVVIDGCIEEYGLSETGLFLYHISSRFALVDEAYSKPKLRVMFAMLLGMMHESFGPEIVCHILVHFMTDLDRELENVRKNPQLTTKKLDNMISFVCYLIAARTCSLKFLEAVLAQIGDRTEEKIQNNVQRILQLTNGIIGKLEKIELEKMIAPYLAAFDEDSDK